MPTPATTPAGWSGTKQIRNHHRVLLQFRNRRADGQGRRRGQDNQPNSRRPRPTVLKAPTSTRTGTLDLDNADNDNSHATGQDDPWDFGTANQYPALKYGELTAADQRPVVSLTLSPTTIYERVGGATTSTVTITSTTEWNSGLTVAVPKDATAYTVSDVAIAAGSKSGTQTLAAVNNYTDAANYSKAMTLGTHPAKISGTTRDRLRGSAALPLLPPS